jgi:uncharacterized membrane protein YdfJ with MMPL/SSD domain
VHQSRNIAARLGRWSAQHRRKAIFGWLAFVIVSFVLGSAIGRQQIDPNDEQVGETGRAAQILDTGEPEAAGEQVLIQSRSATTKDPRFRAAVDDVAQRLDRTKHVQNVVTPYDADAYNQVSKDGRSALVRFEIAGDADQTATRVGATQEATKAAASAHPELRIEQYGDASIDKALTENDDKAMGKAEMTSLPLTLIILVLAFGAFMAAGVPVLLAITGVLGTMGLVGPVSHLVPVSGDIDSMILLIGLAVGVDYSLFYIRREREERAAGRSEDAALEAAAATSGRAVLISGLTVMIAMAGLYLSGISSISGFATGTILVVAVSMLGSVTVLPAVMSKLGDRIEKGRIPGYGRLKARVARANLWSRTVDRVLRRPALAAIISGGLLVALAVPAFGLHTTLSGEESYPRELQVVQTYDRAKAAFPAENVPAVVALKADDVNAPEVKAAIAQLQQRTAERSDLFKAGSHVEVTGGGHVASVSLPLQGTGTDARSEQALSLLRDRIVPETLGSVAGVESATTGFTAAITDFNDTLSSHLPYVFAFVMLAAFLLLLVTFRSLVIPLKAIALNLLSVGAAYGLMVLVFQKGWGESLLGFESNGGIEAWLPIFLFVILFGLSMDYHVFILTRIREAFDRGMPTDDAVAHGIKSTAGTVTSAAIVMVGVFSIFATLPSLAMKELGVGLAAAVLIDATIVRGVLLPASMKLLGDRNWWLPRRLGWLPRLEHEAPLPQPA